MLGANILVGLRLDELRREGGGATRELTCARGERERSGIAKVWAGARGGQAEAERGKHLVPMSSKLAG